jgi:LPS sulfotransferase NodH
MKAIILTSQRSGSTFLGRCLAAHSSIRSHGELLIGADIKAPAPLRGRRLLTNVYRYVIIRGWNPVGIMERHYVREEAPVVLFRAMYNHVDNRGVLNYLTAHKEIRIVHLRRDNLLKQHVSKLLLGVKRERAWQPHTDHKIPVVSVQVSPERAIRDMQRVRDNFIRFEKLLSHHRKTELVYERMYHGQTLSQEAWEKISDLLEIESVPIAADLVKMNPDDLRPMVKNYDELAAALAGTEFERFLD